MKPPSHDYRDKLRYACRVFTTDEDEEVLLGKLINSLSMTELEVFCDIAARIEPSCLALPSYRTRRRRWTQHS